MELQTSTQVSTGFVVTRSILLLIVTADCLAVIAEATVLCTIRIIKVKFAGRT